MSRYIKIPLILGGAAAAATVLLDVLAFGDGFSEGLARDALYNFVLYSVVGLVLMVMQGLRVRRRADETEGRALAVRQSGVFILRLPYDEAFDLCGQSLASVRARLKLADRAAGRIEARTPMTWGTYGCVLAYEVVRVGERLTEVRVTSRPRVRTNIIDYGENRKIVETVGEFLTESDDRLDFALADARLKGLSGGGPNAAAGARREA